MFFVLKMDASNSALLTVFNQWMWNFVKCLFCIYEDDHFRFLPSSDTMKSYVNRLTHSLPLDNPSLAFWNNPHTVVGFVSEPLLLTGINPLDTLIRQKCLRKRFSAEGHFDSWGTLAVPVLSLWFSQMAVLVDPRGQRSMMLLNILKCGV